jgi:oligoendopeptidase F
MKGPAGVSSAEIHGHTYDVGKDGVIKVAIQDHVETLRRHGFEDYLDDRELDKDIDGMDRDDLVEFIEERGGTVDGRPKMKELRKQARQIVGEKA